MITNGSVQADEQMYWYAAQALAKAGYVVMTLDPQGQGQSDTRGDAPDQNEGFPAQTDGRPFFDGTEDARQLLLLDRLEPLRARDLVLDGHQPRGQAGPPRQGRARRRLQPVLPAA